MVGASFLAKGLKRPFPGLVALGWCLGPFFFGGAANACLRPSFPPSRVPVATQSHSATVVLAGESSHFFRPARKKCAGFQPPVVRFFPSLLENIELTASAHPGKGQKRAIPANQGHFHPNEYPNKFAWPEQGELGASDGVSGAGVKPLIFSTDRVISRRILIVTLCSEKEHPCPSPGGHQAVEGSEIFSVMQGVLNKLGRLGPAKGRTDDFIKYIQSLSAEQVPGHLARWLPAMASCASDVQVSAIAPEDRVSLATRLCRHHLACGPCAIQRGARELARAMQRIALLGPAPRMWWMVTMTTKNGPDLGERYNHLTAGLRLFRERGRLRRANSCFRFFSGGMGSLEFKRGARSGLWHPHAHMLMCSFVDLSPWLVKSGDGERGYIYRWPALEAEWHAITGDSFVCEVHPVYAAAAGSFVGALCEVFKYAVKINGVDDLADRMEAVRVLHRRRLLSTWGEFYGQGIDDDDHKAERAGKRVSPAMPAAAVYDYRYSPVSRDYDLINFSVPPPPACVAPGSWDPVLECAHVEACVSG